MGRLLIRAEKRIMVLSLVPEPARRNIQHLKDYPVFQLFFFDFRTCCHGQRGMKHGAAEKMRGPRRAWSKKNLHAQITMIILEKSLFSSYHGDLRVQIFLDQARRGRPTHFLRGATLHPPLTVVLFHDPLDTLALKGLSSTTHAEPALE